MAERIGAVSQVVVENDEDVDDLEQGEPEDESVILQCKNCNTIVGDSMSWVYANDDLKTVTLHSTTNAVTMGKKLMTSTTGGIDLGSTYVHLVCKHCNEVVGKVYKTTSRQLDNLRDLFTFSAHQITSYQVGSNEQTADVDLQNQRNLLSPESIKEEILKIQVMICALNQRIGNIESSLEIKDDDEIPDEEQIKETPKNTQQGGSYTPLNTHSDVIKGTARGDQTPSLQDKVISHHGQVGTSSPVAVQNGRQFTSGKRSKEQTMALGSKGNKRSRYK
ncbi:kinetochore protein mis18-like [Asterias rubens]|uniref:kinetochore protein mis18-like n=1 Tax=Asterias rubens TaxID=7604 RepID=UPI0014559D06|nr:kinetochore protein mis18-like [Asterias rubens]